MPLRMASLLRLTSGERRFNLAVVVEHRGRETNVPEIVFPLDHWMS